MNKILLLFIFLAFGFQGNAQFDNLLSTVNKAKDKILGENADKTGLGLKSALEEGIKISVDQLSAENGYFDSPYKILVPEEAQKVVSTLSKVPGFQNVESDLLAKMNQAAEYAAKKATPIFLDAIKSITFKDATEILMGEENAATMYLEKSSRDKLYDAFLPVIQSALDEVNARKYWSDIVVKYNKLPLTKDVNPELDDHVNQKSLDGLFALIEVKEKGIRGDVNQRTTPLLQEVFARQD